MDLRTLVGMGLIALSVSALDRGLGCYFENKVHEKSEAVAVKLYGDRKEPLDDSEKKEWYYKLGIEEGKEPSRKQLEDFIKKYK